MVSVSATRTPKDSRFNLQNNNSAHASLSLMHFVASTATRNCLNFRSMCSSRKYPCPPQRAFLLCPPPPRMEFQGVFVRPPPPPPSRISNLVWQPLKRLYPSKMLLHYTIMWKMIVPFIHVNTASKNLNFTLYRYFLDNGSR